MERDPVCGTELRPGQEGADCRYQDRAYHFCSVECRQLFEQNPKEYVGGAQTPDVTPGRSINHMMARRGGQHGTHDHLRLWGCPDRRR